MTRMSTADSSSGDSRTTRWLRWMAGTVIAVYLVALLAGPRGPHTWRELGLQVPAFALVAAHATARAVADPRNRRWIAPVAAWMWCMTFGNLVSNTVEGGHASLVSLSTLIFICSYPCALAAVVLAYRGRWRPSGVSQVLEAVTGVLAAASIMVCLVVPRALATIGHDLLGLTVVLVFPLMDLILAALLLIAVALSGHQPERMSGWVALGMSLFAVADWRYALGMADGSWLTGYPVDGVWMVASAVVGLVAVTGPASRRAGQSWSVTAFGITIGSASVALSVMSFGTERRLPRLGVVLAAACLVSALLRMFTAYVEMRELAGVREQARTDELTGLANRRVLYEVLDGLAGEGPVDAVLLLADLDRFKEVNDRFGHAAGDQALIQVAAELRGTAPAGSTVVRMGGDEFAVLARTTQSGDGGVLADALVAAVAALAMPGGISIGVSIGVVDLAAHPAAGRSDLLRLADVAMYLAKGDGRGVHEYTSTDESHDVARKPQHRNLA